MRAMVLAAGLGTRLRPLTNDRPKALVEFEGRSLLEIALARLRDAGVAEVIVNVHHFADMMIDYLRAHDNFGLRVEVSREPELLDTGGGLKKAAWFFQQGPSRTDEPLLLHNVDIISTIDLQRIVQLHRERRPLATLAVQRRDSSRYLLFDGQQQLCGRRADGADELVRACPQPEALGFCGIHVLSSRIFAVMQEEGVFSIIDSYLRLAAEGEKILAFRADEYSWWDLGKPEKVQEVPAEVVSKSAVRSARP